MSSERVAGGVVHKLPAVLRKALIANTTALEAWTDITPLARNEFICWVEDSKQEVTRERRIRRTQEELEEGQRRRCGPVYTWRGRSPTFGPRHSSGDASPPGGSTRAGQCSEGPPTKRRRP